MIVIAHDAKIVKSFAETKEKVFGQSLNVEPNVEEAFEEFIRSHEGRVQGSRRGPPAEAKLARLKSVGKAIFPSDAEVAANPRSRSAVLRIAEKLA